MSTHVPPQTIQTIALSDVTRHRAMSDESRSQPSLWVPLLKRALWGMVTMWGVSLLIFALLFIVPRWGRARFVKKEDAAKIVDPARMMAMNMAGAHTSPENIDNIMRERGLDQPLPTQYLRFVRDALTNNLKSYRNDDLVMSAIWRRFPATLALALAGLTIYLAVSVPLGLATASRSGSWFDRSALLLGLLAISIPTFWLGRLLQQSLAYRMNWFSVGGGASLWNLPLPALTLGIGGAALYARLLHANLRGVLGQDYIRAARARGLSENNVLGRHALKNALIPLVTILGMDFASLLSGLIFTEKIFAWPGIGSLIVDSVANSDAPMIMGTVLFSALMVVVMSIVVDLAYRWIDPRVRFE